METVSGLLASFGLLGILVAGFLGFVTLLILPFWAIVECAFSERTGGLKAFLLILLIFTWGFGSLIYGLFVTTSKLLRIFTILAVVGVLAILVPSVISVLAGAGIHSNVRAEQLRKETRELKAQFVPESIPAGDLAPFHALHFSWGGFSPATAALARFTGSGVDVASARDTDRGVRHVAVDANRGRVWAITTHEFGAIDPATGRFARIDVDPAAGDFSWPKGIVLDPDDGAVLVMTSHVFTEFFRYDPESGAWTRLPVEIRDLPLVALAASPTDGLYALERRSGERALRRLQRFNAMGASLGPVELHPAIPIADRSDEGFQLQGAGDKLVLILPPMDPSEPSRTLVVDPRSGVVLEPRRRRDGPPARRRRPAPLRRLRNGRGRKAPPLVQDPEHPDPGARRVRGRLDAAVAVRPPVRPLLDDARRTVVAWREDYNNIRPHSALGGRTPAEFRASLELSRAVGEHEKLRA